MLNTVVAVGFVGRIASNKHDVMALVLGGSQEKQAIVAFDGDGLGF